MAEEIPGNSVEGIIGGISQDYPEVPGIPRDTSRETLVEFLEK